MDLFDEVSALLKRSKLDNAISACEDIAALDQNISGGGSADSKPKQVVLSRRTALMAMGIGVLTLLGPGYAMADWNCGFWTKWQITDRGHIGDDFGNVYYDGVDLYNESNAHCETGWMEIKLNNYSSPQFIAVSIVANLVGDFTTELYHWAHAKSFAAWTSYNALTKRDCWTNDGNDHYQSFPWYWDGNYQGDLHKFDYDLPQCKNRDWSQDYRWTNPYECLHDSYHNFRRDGTRHTLKFAGYANEYHFGGTWTNPEEFSYSTKRATYYTKPIKIDKDQRWMLRAVKVLPKNLDGCAVAMSAQLSSSGHQKPYLPALDDTANQVFCIMPRRSSDRLTGTAGLAPLPYQGYRLDVESGEEPNRNESNGLHLYDQRTFDSEHAMAQSFWLYEKDGTYWLFIDASGHALDAQNGQSKGALLQVHSSGYCDSEWDNKSHQWYFEDEVLEYKSGVDRIPLSNETTDSVVVLENPGKYSTPYDGEDVYLKGQNTNGIAYSIDWIAHDRPEDVECYNDYVRLEGDCTIKSANTFIRTSITGQRADACIGSPAATAITSFSLKVVGSSLSGGVQYKVHRSGQGSNMDSWCSNGETAGNKSDEITQIQIKLTGEIADKYDLWVWAEEGGLRSDGYVISYDNTSSLPAIRASRYFVARLVPKGLKFKKAVLAADSCKDIKHTITSAERGKYLTAYITAYASELTEFGGVKIAGNLLGQTFSPKTWEPPANPTKSVKITG